MTSTLHANGHTYKVETPLIEVTSMHRADETWVHTDAAGHAHRWWFNGQPGVYSPTARLSLPTLEWKKDGEYYDEDGEPHETGHYECNECSERVQPGFTSDTDTQYMAGLRRCYIDGESVSEEVFRAAIEGLEP